MTGQDIDGYIRTLREQTPGQVAQTVQSHAELMALLDQGRTRGGQPIFISEHEDRVVSEVQAGAGVPLSLIHI